MLFAVQPGRKIDAIGVAVGGLIARHESPQAVNLDGFAVSPIQLAKVVVGLKVENINGAVAEIPNQEVIGELPAGAIASPQGELRWPRVATRSSNCPSMLNSST